MFFGRRDHPLARTLETVALAERSPTVEGVIEGTKAGVFAAPIFAALQAMRNKSPIGGAIVGGIGAGTLIGLAAAAKQKYHNTRSEAYIKYHLDNLREREAEERENLRPGGFSGGFDRVYNPY